MTYALQQLAAGNYDLHLDGEVVGSVVRNILPSGHNRGWRGELANDSNEAWKPPPFTKSEHEFDSLVAVSHWLDKTMIIAMQKRRSNA